MPWEELRDRLAYDATVPTPEDLDATRFLFESPHVRIKHELADYAADCFPPGTPVLIGAQAIDGKDFQGIHVRPGSHHGVYAGHGSAGKEAWRLPGFRPPDDRLPARPRPRRATSAATC
jgi:hypothetical protein